jgi:hypothetical protein
VSKTLNLTCDDCLKTLLVGQHNRSSGWCVVAHEDRDASALNEFVNIHIGHKLRFEDSDAVGDDVEDLTNYE